MPTPSWLCVLSKTYCNKRGLHSNVNAALSCLVMPRVSKNRTRAPPFQFSTLIPLRVIEPRLHSL